MSIFNQIHWGVLFRVGYVETGSTSGVAVIVTRPGMEVATRAGREWKRQRNGVPLYSSTRETARRDGSAVQKVQYVFLPVYLVS